MSIVFKTLENTNVLYTNMEFHVGFIGSSMGITHKQEATLKVLLSMFRSVCVEHSRGALNKTSWHFHHCDCVGADLQAHSIADSLYYIIDIHPPAGGEKRARTASMICGKIYPAYHYSDRIVDIVAASNVLIATPTTPTDHRLGEGQVRGTLASGWQVEDLAWNVWTTIFLAHEKKIPVWVILPDGKLLIEGKKENKGPG